MITPATALPAEPQPVIRDASRVRPLSTDDYDDIASNVRNIAIRDASVFGDDVLSDRPPYGIAALADIAIIYGFEETRGERQAFNQTLNALHAQITRDDHNALAWHYIEVFAGERAKRGRS